jgi:hypothetical protein
MNFLFIAEPDPARATRWRVVCCSSADPFVMGSGFREEPNARAWARWLNDRAEQAEEDPLGIDTFSPEEF